MENLHQATSCNFGAGKHDGAHGRSMLTPLGAEAVGGRFNRVREIPKRAKERTHIM